MSEQPVMGSHYCAACGQIHGGERTDAEVRIAKINADRDIEVARLQRSEYQHAVDVDAETAVAVTELQTEAGVLEAEALGDALGGGGGDESPVIIDVPADDVEPEIQDSIEPRDDEDDGAPPAEAKSSGLSYWP
jgi:hypothetical protein